VKLSSSAKLDPSALAGRVVHFRNKIRQTSHPIASAKLDGDVLTLTMMDDLIVGKVRIDSAQGDTLATQTAMMLAELCRGTTLCDQSYRPLATVAGAGGGTIKLTSAIADASAVIGKDAWLINVGPGDEFELPAIIGANDASSLLAARPAPADAGTGESPAGQARAKSPRRPGRDSRRQRRQVRSGALD
jgi:hypothetical protein